MTPPPAKILVKDLHLVMEFLGGGSMEDVLAMRRFLPETQVGSVGLASFGRCLVAAVICVFFRGYHEK